MKYFEKIIDEVQTSIQYESPSVFTYFPIIGNSTTEKAKFSNKISSIQENIDFALVDASYCVYLTRKHYKVGRKTRSYNNILKITHGSIGPRIGPDNNLKAMSFFQLFSCFFST